MSEKKRRKCATFLIFLLFTFLDCPLYLMVNILLSSCIFLGPCQSHLYFKAQITHHQLQEALLVVHISQRVLLIPAEQPDEKPEASFASLEHSLDDFSALVVTDTFDGFPLPIHTSLGSGLST